MKITGKRKVLILVAGTLLLLAGIVFLNQRHERRTIRDLVVTVNQPEDMVLLQKEEIEQWLQEEREAPIVGQPLSAVNLHAIEEQIESREFVKRAEVYVSINGVLNIQVNQDRVIARLVGNREGYVADDGSLLPLKPGKTVRVPLVSGYPEGADTLQWGSQFLNLLQFIDADPFWKAQVAQMEVTSNREIILYPQIGKQYVEMGLPENIEEKFSKLKIVYTRILPRKGWNRYNRVNINFKDQIVCE